MKNVIVYSAGGMAEKVSYSLDPDKFNVIAFVDRNPELHGKRYLFNRPIIPIEELPEWTYDLLIIAVSMFEEEIRIQIEPYVDKDKIVVFLPNSHGIVWADERWIMARKCCSIIKERGIPGSIAELGVYKGEFARILNQCLPDRTLYLFDTFEGFGEARDTLDDGKDTLRFKDTSVEKVISVMPYPEKCIIRKGWFPETIGDLEEQFCFVSLDCDLYEPTREGLKYFYPRLSRGGYIFIHDFGHNHYNGVKRAVYEFMESEKSVAIVPVVDRGSTVVIAK